MTENLLLETKDLLREIETKGRRCRKKLDKITGRYNNTSNIESSLRISLISCFTGCHWFCLIIPMIILALFTYLSGCLNIKKRKEKLESRLKKYQDLEARINRIQSSIMTQETFDDRKSENLRDELTKIKQELSFLNKKLKNIDS